MTGSKSERAYAWAWLTTTSPRHFLLIRKHLHTGELVFHYAYVPPGQPVTLMALVRVACLCWSVEEDVEFGKDHFGLDHSQVCLHIALTVAEIKRLFHPVARHLHWVWWRRRHQARARWFHHRARLRRHMASA
ncbi:hypothetical protein DMH04_49970 [Kibdelosporangium aridum]|uniref:Uncharacterized protein n=1 Tax=Kibdelosporangium aridum TaxID=2030 RepID=A0A428YC10_KIBAR|nr:hypothetical protein [Kibdelosporangium aridum]RSM65089.1 hypothetical protein DMH04_49970 [Kibdelosporangium aridum]